MTKCRSCLAPGAQELTDRLCEVLSLCVNVNNQDIPVTCHPCREVLQTFYEFREKARSVEQLLKHQGSNCDEKTASADVENKTECIRKESGKKRKCIRTRKKNYKDRQLDNEEVSDADLVLKAEYEDFISPLSDIQESSLQNCEKFNSSENGCSDTRNIIDTQIENYKSKRKRSSEYVCEQCGYRAVDRCSLRVHARRHTGERPYACALCHKTFTTPGNLKTHSRVHSGERPFMCELCGRSFGAAASLRGHARTHSGERPYACGRCPRRFTLRSNLRQHERVHSGEKPYSCDICQRAFKSSSDARAHRRTHTDERPHACALCPRRFAVAGNLRAHSRTHASTRALACTTCGEEFATKAERMAHARAHHVKRKTTVAQLKFPCDSCGRRFARKCNLVMHKRREKCVKAAQESTNENTANTDVPTPPTNHSPAVIQLPNQNVIVHSHQIFTNKLFVESRPQGHVAMMQLASTGATVGPLASTITTVVPLTLVPISILKQ